MKNDKDKTEAPEPPLDQASGSGDVVHGFQLPDGKDAASLDWWPEFAAYFEEQEGFQPHPRDSHAKRLFEYFVEGAYQQFRKNNLLIGQLALVSHY